MAGVVMLAALDGVLLPRGDDTALTASMSGTAIPNAIDSNANEPMLPSFFSSNMVLQRAPARAAIWGFRAAPGETVRAALLDDSTAQQWVTTASPEGTWNMSLSPQPASSGRKLTLSFETSRRQRVLTNVAFGDVYLCSGQSNMEVRPNKKPLARALSLAHSQRSSHPFPCMCVAVHARQRLERHSRARRLEPLPRPAHVQRGAHGQRDRRTAS
jgi:hypothetical protein